ncbi:MAG: hypothetical protein MJ078_00480, partial [Clostridia bacterium]|nr:hypothetical protein [Clostridia bacterium]
DSFDDTVSLKLPAGDYTVKVYPVSHYGKAGRAVSASLKVREKDLIEPKRFGEHSAWYAL